jgi:hypothetical protein
MMMHIHRRLRRLHRPRHPSRLKAHRIIALRSEPATRIRTCRFAEWTGLRVSLVQSERFIKKRVAVRTGDGRREPRQRQRRLQIGIVPILLRNEILARRLQRACLIRSDLSRPCLVSEATFSRRSRAKSALLLLGFLGGGICQPYIVLPRSQRDSLVIPKIAPHEGGNVGRPARGDEIAIHDDLALQVVHPCGLQLLSHPAMRPVAIKSWGPWQIAARGLSA